MINWKEMQRSIDEESETETPIATDERVQNIIRRKIKAICKSIESPFIHLSYPYGLRTRLDYREELFSFTADDYSFLEENLRNEKALSPNGIKKWKVESDRLQQLGLGIMKKEYSLDENISQPGRHSDDSRDWAKDGTIDYGDGSMGEIRLFPKTAIDGLAFERFREFDKTTGNTLSVYWSVVDNAPSRINWKKKAKSKLNPVSTA